MPDEPDAALGSLCALALGLSSLDSEVKWLKGAAPGSEQFPLRAAGRRLSRYWLDSRLNAVQASSPAVYGARPRECLEGLLVGNRSTLHASRLGDASDLPDSLSKALSWAIELGFDIPRADSRHAGAIYLYDWRHDELVMAASLGFPLRWPNCRDDIDRLANDDRTKARRNVERLWYLQAVLQREVVASGRPRDPWVNLALRVVPSRFGFDKLKPELTLDSNELLVGVAHYRPGAGITGQLFDRTEGAVLERDFFAEVSDGVKTELVRRFEEAALMEHLWTHLFQERTVIYRHRGDMATGRQIKAGRYEGLQFPTSSNIGPFLGTVLRFNGEHLGILKVEGHNFRSPDGDAKPPSGGGTARFLVLAYALAGLLYVFKHHASVDLRSAWNSCLLRG